MILEGLMTGLVSCLFWNMQDSVKACEVMKDTHPSSCVPLDTAICQRSGLGSKLASKLWPVL